MKLVGAGCAQQCRERSQARSTRLYALANWPRKQHHHRIDEGNGNVHILNADGAPGWDEYAIFDAILVSAGASPELVVNEDVLRMSGLGRSALDDEMKAQLREIERRRLLYFGGRLLREC